MENLRDLLSGREMNRISPTVTVLGAVQFLPQPQDRHVRGVRGSKAGRRLLRARSPDARRGAGKGSQQNDGGRGHDQESGHGQDRGFLRRLPPEDDQSQLPPPPVFEGDRYAGMVSMRDLMNGARGGSGAGSERAARVRDGAGAVLEGARRRDASMRPTLRRAARGAIVGIAAALLALVAVEFLFRVWLRVSGESYSAAAAEESMRQIVDVLTEGIPTLRDGATSAPGEAPNGRAGIAAPVDVLHPYFGIDFRGASPISPRNPPTSRARRRLATSTS